MERGKSGMNLLALKSIRDKGIYKNNNGAYSLLLGLEHDVESMETLPYQEQCYLIGRINKIKESLEGAQ